MKRTKVFALCSLLLAVLGVLALSACGSPEWIPEKDTSLFTFREIEGGYEVTQYIGEDSCAAVSIPATFIGKPVVSINDFAFFDCSGPAIITIPGSVTRIGDDALSGYSPPTNITILDTTANIGDSAFSDCSVLTSITVADGNSVYHSSGNCLINTASKTLIAGCKNSVIPSDGSVTSIGNNAFYGCSDLTSITIPGSVMTIDKHAFYGCNNLTSATFASTNGWHVIPSSIIPFRTNISFSTNVTDPAQNARALESTYSDYHWQRR